MCVCVCVCVCVRECKCALKQGHAHREVRKVRSVTCECAWDLTQLVSVCCVCVWTWKWWNKIRNIKITAWAQFFTRLHGNLVPVNSRQALSFVHYVLSALDNITFQNCNENDYVYAWISNCTLNDQNQRFRSVADNFQGESRAWGWFHLFGPAPAALLECTNWDRRAKDENNCCSGS